MQSRKHYPYCWNCGKQLDKSEKRCLRCSAPMDDEIKNEIISRLDVVSNIKCWSCNGQTSGYICGICGAPLTKNGLKITKELALKPAIVRHEMSTISDRLVLYNLLENDMQYLNIGKSGLRSIVSRYFEIDHEVGDHNFFRGFLVRPKNDLEEDWSDLLYEEIFEKNHITPMLNLDQLINEDQITDKKYEKTDIGFLYFKRETLKEKVESKYGILSIVLFVLTLASIAITGWLFTSSLYEFYQITTGRYYLDIFLFFLVTVVIFTANQTTQIIYSHEKKLNYSLPLFIPLPSLTNFMTPGILGVVMRMKTIFPDRNSLFYFGILGPTVGLIISLIGSVLSMYFHYPTYIDMSNISVPLLYPTSIFDIMNSWFADFSGFYDNLDPNATAAVFNPIHFACNFGILINGIMLLPAVPANGGFSAEAILDSKFAKILAIISGIILILSISFFSIIGLIMVVNNIRGSKRALIQNRETKPHWIVYLLFTITTLWAVMAIPFPMLFYKEFFTGNLF